MPIQPFNKEIALCLAYASKYTYGLNTPIPEAVKKNIFQLTKTFEVEPFFYSHGDLSGFVGYFQYENNEYIVIAFRGSEAPGDWATNFQFAQIEDFNSQGMIHSGFANIIDKHYIDIKNIIERKLNKNQKLLLTGHSLGGALAILAATRFSPFIEVEAVYTYGSPRVGDQVFVQSYKPTHYRVEYGNDIVPHLPISRGITSLVLNDTPIPIEYQHTGILNYLVKGQKKIEDLTGWNRLKSEIFKGNLANYLKPEKILDNHSIDSYIKYLEKCFYSDKSTIIIDLRKNENQLINNFIHKAISLAQSVSCTDVITELKELKERWNLPGFRLGFVGEFSRGKSTLINRILGRNLLPVGAIPTTGCLISIVAGTQESLKVRSSQNGWEIRTIKQSSWSDLLANHQVSDNQNVITEVCLTVNHSWLQAIDVELIDTPGAGDLSSHRAALLYDVLSKCDAAIILISATSPFSMTEAVFLEQEVLGRHIPNVFVAVSNLDKIPQQEKGSVLEVISNRVMEISTAIPILPLHPLGSSASENDVLKQVRTQIESMVNKGERRIGRKRKVLNQLIDYLNLLIEIGQSVISIERGDAIDRREVLGQADQYMKNSQLAWENILHNFEQRRKQHEQKWNQKIISFQEELKRELSIKLHNSKDIKNWSESVMPKILKHRLLSLKKELENDTLIVISDNFKWLQDEVNQKFAKQIAAKDINFPNLNNFKIDTDHSPILAGLATGVAMMFGGVVGKIIELVSNLIIGSARDNQRQTLERKLDKVIGQVVDEYCQTLSERLREIYNQLIQETEKNQTVWCTAWESSVKKSINEGDDIKWKNLITQVSALKQEIESFINSGM
ncbi:DUF2974 domain-containing protein [Anabaena sp. UHCC 0253]|uniref:dynamin family protein n=1 Tax=Anabaena sp. UHCC 0253 TaxID=2590019 RepID=UPI0014463FAC|nr:dynamin family protein [Anabaena sp. UHCC 0253]MTJ51570.1 DUF2974 domain-containing protein [Anabaena sp. UHCC 0253]